MTSTPFNVGLGDGSRSSSRVLRPPGGGHTDIFGGEPEPVRGRRLVPAPGTNNDNVTYKNKAVANNAIVEETAQAVANQNGAGDEPTKQNSSNITPIQETKENMTENNDKGKISETMKAESVKPEPTKAELPKRVRVPPGGFSSGLW